MFEIFSTTHIILLLLIPIVCIFAYSCSKKAKNIDLVFTLSFLLFSLEIFKQFYTYFILHTWEVWIFPWQLCSIPLYIWLLKPFKNQSWFDSIYFFLMDYTLLGTLCALAYPEDMIKEQLILTIHSFSWHYILVFISVYILFTYTKPITLKGFIRGSIVFIIGCVVATLINISLSSYGDINMFYINPYYISTQPVFREIGIKYGILIQNLSYIITIMIGSYLIQVILKNIKSYLE